MVLRALWCKEEPGPNFGHEILCQIISDVQTILMWRHRTNRYRGSQLGRGHNMGRRLLHLGRALSVADKDSAGGIISAPCMLSRLVAPRLESWNLEPYIPGFVRCG